MIDIPANRSESPSQQYLSKTGKTLKTENALGIITVTNSYDARDLLVSTTDALGNTTTYTHDKEGRVVTETPPAAIPCRSSHPLHPLARDTTPYSLVPDPSP